MQIENPDKQESALRLSGVDFENLHEIVRKARQNLDQNAWDYIVGGTESETTLRRNRMALDSIAFRPRVLRDVSTTDASVHEFGRKLRLPVLIAPVGALETFDDGAGATVVRAAAEFGIPHMLSSVSQPGLEGVAKAAPNACRIFQLYVRGDDAFVDDHARRAMDHGYAAFAITVDVAHYSRRERDLAKRHVTAGRRRVQGREHQAALDWRTVDRVKKLLNIPLVIKGIHTAEDARLCLEHGVDWIYVSNHGGRQLDHGRGSIEFLPEIVAVAKGKAKIMIDGGFYVVITGVVSNSPIDKAGVHVNDVVLAVDGVPVRAQEELAAKLRLTTVGQQVSFTVDRGGATQNHTATMGRCLVRDTSEKNLALTCKSWTH
jgi:glycolate oxidase